MSIPKERLFKELNQRFESKLPVNEIVAAVIHEDMNDPDIAIECIYFLLDILLYGRYVDRSEGHSIELLLRDVFRSTYSRFGDNPRFLCFVGYFIAVSYWYFDEPDLSRSHEMMKRAYALEPQNMLYEWAWKFSTADPSAIPLAEQLLESSDLIAEISNSMESAKFLMDAIRESVRPKPSRS